MSELFSTAGEYVRTASNDVAQYATTTFPEPRPFQRTAHDALREGAKAGDRCQMLMAPTGAGKTYLGLRVCKEALERGRRAIFVCDRTTLIEQTSMRADEYGLSAHGIYQADHPRTNLNYPFQIASAQTLARRKWPSADVIVIDEAHTQLKAWTETIPTHCAHVIGLSATPFSRGLGKLFTRLVNATTMRELTDSGVLVPMRVMTCTAANMQGAETRSGEWTEKAAEQRGMEIIGDVVSEWHQHANGRKTIVFGATIAHCEEMARLFNASGVGAAVFSAHTTPSQRAAMLAEYRKPDGDLRILLSVEALAKGFDVPDVECVVDCRPLRKSLSTAMQMWGRGLRSAPGKTDCLLLDHTGNILRFWKDYEAIYHDGLDALDAGEKLDKAIRTEEDEDKSDKACPACGHKPFFGHCTACGHEVHKKSDVIAMPGQMVEVSFGKGKGGVSRRDLWEQVCAYARGHSAPDKQAGRAANIYRDFTGNWPPTQWRFQETPGAPISRDVLNRIKAKNIAYAKRRAA